MQVAAFNARCPFEIGDTVCVRGQNVGKSELLSQEIKVITDIACIHYVKSGVVEFRYEFDGSGAYEQLQHENLHKQGSGSSDIIKRAIKFFSYLAAGAPLRNVMLGRTEREVREYFRMAAKALESGGRRHED